MELNNDFEVSAPIEKAWAVLTDVERIAPCLPGAQLQEVEGDEYRGIVKVKVGPITAQYKGAASFVEKDDINKKAVLKADGRDTRGAGNASAFITAQLTPVGNRTKVEVRTDLTVTGKVAQFGRGVMADISAKLMRQFADNLEKLLEDDLAVPETQSAPTGESSGDDTAVAAPVTETPTLAQSTGPRKIDMPEPKAVDLLDTAGAPVLKRLAPVLAVLLVLFLLRRKLRRK